MMIGKKYFFVLMLMCCSVAMSAEECVVQPGEKIVYRAHYGFFTAGYATFSTQDPVGDEKDILFTDIDFKTTSFVEKLFKIHYAFESEYFVQDCLPRYAGYKLVEGDRSWEDKTLFKQQEHYLVSENNGELNFGEAPVRDIVSAIGYIRSIDWSKYQQNDTISFLMYFREHEIFPLNVIYQGKETVKLDGGEVRCIKLNPVNEPGKLFNGKSTINIWLSDDAYKVPVLISTDVLIGSFKLDLVEYEGSGWKVSSVK